MNVPGKATLSYLLTLLAIASAVVTYLLTGPAGAAGISACPELHYNIVGYEGDGTHRGILVSTGMWVYNSSAECARVSTMDQYLDVNHQIELGWFEAPEGGCGYSGTSPRRLAVVTLYSAQTCPSSPPALTAGEFHPFRFQDSNADGVWSFVDRSTNFWTFDVGWTFGTATVQGERHGSSDIPTADFNGLQKDTATGWVIWAFASYDGDNDPSYYLFIQSSQRIKVLAG